MGEVRPDSSPKRRCSSPWCSFQLSSIPVRFGLVNNYWVRTTNYPLGFVHRRCGIDRRRAFGRARSSLIFLVRSGNSSTGERREDNWPTGVSVVGSSHHWLSYLFMVLQDSNWNWTSCHWFTSSLLSSCYFNRATCHVTLLHVIINRQRYIYGLQR